MQVACLLLFLISQRNITVPPSVMRLSSAEEKYWLLENPEARLKKTFRVSRVTFNFISVNRIDSFIVRQTVTKKPIPPELRLALCLHIYRLGREDFFLFLPYTTGRVLISY